MVLLRRQRLFRAAAEAETVHAHTHLRVLKGIRSTKENLKEAIAGETHEFKSMYPGMIEKAKAEGNKEAERSFNFANEVEKIHARLYQQMFDNLEKRKRYLTAITFVRYADIQRKKKLRKHVLCAALKVRCLKRLIDNTFSSTNKKTVNCLINLSFLKNMEVFYYK